MRSGYRLYWTDEALNNLDSIFDYLTIYWTDREIRNFYRLLDERIELISNNPHTFPDSDLGPKAKRCVISKQPPFILK